jgi:hypothetical protein
MTAAAERRPIVPAFVLARFADPAGQVMLERRDRTRRRTASIAEAAAEAGAYALVPDRAAALAAALDRIEQHAEQAIDRVIRGDFPPRGEDRAALALFGGLGLLLGRGQRAAVTEQAAVLGQLIEARVPDDDETPDDPPDAPTPSAGDVVLLDDEPVRAGLGELPRVARLLAARTWQLVRFPRLALLTSDTPVALWSRPGGPSPYPAGLGAADEVRIPIDPRHALILARVAPAGEVVRDLGDRHASALNRTMAEVARRWMFYHPEGDPLLDVELARTP